jgi:hypothetical protein
MPPTKSIITLYIRRRQNKIEIKQYAFGVISHDFFNENIHIYREQNYCT